MLDNMYHTGSEKKEIAILLEIIIPIHTSVQVQIKEIMTVNTKKKLVR